MSLEFKHDFMGSPYIEGDINDSHVIGEPKRDLITGKETWDFNVRKDNSADFSGVGSVMKIVIMILLVPIAIALPVVVWKSIFSQAIPELIVASLGSVAISAYIILREPSGFFDALQCATVCIWMLHALLTSILSFIVQTPAMATPFSLGAILGILFVSFIASIAPAVIISIISAIAYHLH